MAQLDGLLCTPDVELDSYPSAGDTALDVLQASHEKLREEHEKLKAVVDVLMRAAAVADVKAATISELLSPDGRAMADAWEEDAPSPDALSLQRLDDRTPCASIASTGGIAASTAAGRGVDDDDDGGGGGGGARGVHSYLIVAATAPGASAAVAYGAMGASLLIVMLQAIVMLAVLAETSFPRCVTDDDCRTGEFCAPAMFAASWDPGICADCALARNLGLADAPDDDGLYDRASFARAVGAMDARERWNALVFCNETDAMPERCDHPRARDTARRHIPENIFVRNFPLSLTGATTLRTTARCSRAPRSSCSSSLSASSCCRSSTTCTSRPPSTTSSSTGSRASRSAPNLRAAKTRATALSQRRRALCRRGALARSCASTRWLNTRASSCSRGASSARPRGCSSPGR